MTGEIEYRPKTRTTLLVFLSFFALVLPAIWLSGMGYICLLEHVFGPKFDVGAENIHDNLMILAAIILIIPIMMGAIILASIPWMYLMARILSWKDLRFFVKTKRPHLPVVSGCIKRHWLHIARHRRTNVLRHE